MSLHFPKWCTQQDKKNPGFEKKREENVPEACERELIQAVAQDCFIINSALTEERSFQPFGYS